MVSFKDTIAGWFGAAPAATPSVTGSNGSFVSPVNSASFDGDKFYGGFGATQVFTADYWTLRERSAQLFTENLYARGLVRRLVTNVINTGLTLEAMPDEAIIGVAPDSLTDWTESTESRHALWAADPASCDYHRRRPFGEIQKDMYREALVEGDVLVVLHVDPRTGLPAVQLINGRLVSTPMGVDAGLDIRHGVELDRHGRHVAFYVTQADGTSTRIAATGAASGRHVAWLFYGTDKRADDVRGQPMLSLILQSMKELDRYRDAALRKAVTNSIVAMFIEKSEDKPGTLPISGGAVRKGSGVATDNTGTPRRFNIAEQVPGMVIEELQQGERPVPHSTAGTDVNFGAFEASIVHAMAWANEVPPEILQLAFSSNYSASQAATNEFKLYLNMERTRIGAAVLQSVYVEWLTGSVLTGKVSAPGFLEARVDPSLRDVFASWTSADWSGAIKPSVDLLKQARGYGEMVDRGWLTDDRAARELTGTKFSKNIKRQKKANEMKADAMAPLAEPEPGGFTQ